MWTCVCVFLYIRSGATRSARDTHNHTTLTTPPLLLLLLGKYSRTHANVAQRRQAAHDGSPPPVNLIIDCARRRVAHAVVTPLQHGTTRHTHTTRRPTQINVFRSVYERVAQQRRHAPHSRKHCARMQHAFTFYECALRRVVVDNVNRNNCRT